MVGPCCRTPRDGGEDDNDADDFENSGPHTDDRLNCADGDGRVRVNMTTAADESPIYLDELTASVVKPHQVGRAMYN